MLNLIEKEYHHNWILDNLPAASVIEAEGTTKTSYRKGVPVGYVKGPRAYVYNHVQLIVKYHLTEEGTARIVGLRAPASPRGPGSLTRFRPDRRALESRRRPPRSLGTRNRSPSSTASRRACPGASRGRTARA